MSFSDTVMEWNIFFFVRNQWDNIWTGLRHTGMTVSADSQLAEIVFCHGVNLVTSTSNRTPWFTTILLFACPVEPMIIYLGQTRKHFDCVGLDKVSQWACHGGSCSDWKKFVDVFFKFQRRVSLESSWDWLHVSQPTTLGVGLREPQTCTTGRHLGEERKEVCHFSCRGDRWPPEGVRVLNSCFHIYFFNCSRGWRHIIFERLWGAHDIVLSESSLSSLLPSSTLNAVISLAYAGMFV